MHNYVEAIKKSGLTIYDRIEENGKLWIPNASLENTFQNGLQKTVLDGMQARTRSKFVKQRICAVLGYPIPDSFQKTSPRFPGQNFDVFVQKSDNIQIWNEKIPSERRYSQEIRAFQ